MSSGFSLRSLWRAWADRYVSIRTLPRISAPSSDRVAPFFECMRRPGTRRMRWIGLSRVGPAAGRVGRPRRREGRHGRNSSTSRRDSEGHRSLGVVSSDSASNRNRSPVPGVLRSRSCTHPTGGSFGEWGRVCRPGADGSGCPPGTDRDLVCQPCMRATNSSNVSHPRIAGMGVISRQHALR